MVARIEDEEERVEVQLSGFRAARRSRFFIGLFCRAGALAVILAMALPAFASLGGSVNSVESDRARMRASESVTHANGYEIDEIRAPYGTVVDEYISSGGKVFAVTWHGQFPPQMQQILGSYFEEYADDLQAQQPQKYGHRPLDIQDPDLVVQTFGHMGAYYGRAYVPDLLPSGVQADHIQ
jgi:hypothetical protein